MLPYYYSIFGLKIASELECPELQPGSGDCDVAIRFGKVPAALANPKITGIRFERNKNEFLLNVDNVASYYVTANEVIIHKNDDSDLDSVRILLYSSVFAALLLLNNIIPLCASALEKNGKAFLITGNHGVGKSTLATAFYKKGYSIMSDDVTVVNFVDGFPKALPGIIFPALWEKTLEHFDEDKKNFKKVRPVLKKYWFDDIIYNYNKDHVIEKIIFLVGNNCEEIGSKEISGQEKLDMLMGNTMGGNFLFGEQNKKIQSSQFSELVQKVEMLKLCRPEEINTINEVVSLIEKKLE